MYTIPFLLWTSDKWQATHPRDFSQDVNRKYSLAELIHTWSDLAGLSYDGYDPTRSVVNPQFKETTRWIVFLLARVPKIFNTPCIKA